MDGLKLVGCEGLYPIFVSSDYGNSWVPLTLPTNNWASGKLSSDGNRLVAIANGGGIYKWQPTVPLIASQPATQTTLGGDPARLGAGVFSTVPVSYQWQFDGTSLPEATNSSLNLTASPANAGTYSVLVSNSYGAVLSSNAVLTVVPAFVSTHFCDFGISDGILAGSVTTGSNTTVVWFNWGLDTNYGNVTPAYPVPDGVISLNFSNRITGLAPYTVYHYQAMASNSLGTVAGSDLTFATAPRFIETTGSNGNWTALAFSSDGGSLFALASNVLFLSTNSGAGWTRIGGANFSCFVPSSDGSAVAGVAGGALYLTTNLASPNVKWTTNSTPAVFGLFAGSADLRVLAACGNNNLYISTNTGATWNLALPGGYTNWGSTAVSADGTEFVALATFPAGSYNRQSAVVLVSTDSAATWRTSATFGGIPYYFAIAASANGQTLALVAELAYFSSDRGNTWQLGGELVLTGLTQLALSATGQTIIAANNASVPPELLVSPDFGGHWFGSSGGADYPQGNAKIGLVSADGAKFAALSSSNIFISEPNPPPLLTVRATPATIQLSWLQPVANYLLQQSPDLKTWSPVTTPPQLNITNLQYQLQLPRSPTQTFFRLKSN
jgi:hypothetical protein